MPTLTHTYLPVLSIGDRVVVRPCLAEALYQRWVIKQDQDQDHFMLADKKVSDSMCVCMCRWMYVCVSIDGWMCLDGWMCGCGLDGWMCMDK